jgi:hypothetical protein
VLTKDISLCHYTQGLREKDYLLWVQGVFLPLGGEVTIRIGGEEAATLSAIQLSEGRYLEVPSVLIDAAGGSVDFAGPPSNEFSPPWEIRTLEVLPIADLPVRGPVESVCGENSVGMFAFRFSPAKGKNFLSVRLASGVPEGGIQIILNGALLTEIARNGNEEIQDLKLRLELPSDRLSGKNLLVIRSTYKLGPFVIREAWIASESPLPRAAIFLPSSKACGWAPEIGLTNAKRDITYSFPPRKESAFLSFEAYDADSPDEIEIRVNEKIVRILEAGTSDEAWSAPIVIAVPKEFLKADQPNFLTFTNRYNLKRRYRWAVRNVMVSAPLDDEKPDGTQPSFDPLGSAGFLFQFEGRPGGLELNYEAMGIDNSEEVEIFINGVFVGMVPASSEPSNKGGDGYKKRALFLKDSLIQDAGANSISFRRAAGQVRKPRRFGIRRVEILKASETGIGDVLPEVTITPWSELPEPSVPIVLDLDSSPRGATVYWSYQPGFEGDKVGETPLSFEFDRPTWVYLTMKKEGYGAVHTRLYLNEGSQNTFKTGLPPFKAPTYDQPKILARPGIHLPGAAEYLRPFPVDLDENGVIDIVCGDKDGNVLYLQNASTDPAKIEVSDAVLLKAGKGIVRVDRYASPVFVDWDQDGYGDLLVGEESGKIFLFRGNGQGVQGSFESPLALKAAGKDIAIESGSAAPFVVDFNGDGRKDLLVGSGSGVIYLFLNTTGDSLPQLMEGVPLNLPVMAAPYGMNSIPVDFSDWTGDGRTDLVVGTMVGNYYLFENVSQTSLPVFGEPKLLTNLSNDNFIGIFPAAFLFDLNWDGTRDMLVGNAAGELWFVEGTN